VACVFLTEGVMGRKGSIVSGGRSFGVRRRGDVVDDDDVVGE
jgi:hypothetical protein